MKNRFLVVSIALSFNFYAQEQFGASASNYTPTLSVFTNPSSMLDAKTKVDIHLVGAGVYAINNLVYLDKSGIIPLARQRGNSFDINSVKFNKDRKRYKVYSRVFANVLSGVWSQGDHAAGLFFNVRSFTMARGYSKNFRTIIDSAVAGVSLSKNKEYSFPNIFLSSLNFGEVQASYGYTFYKERRDMMMGGISIKKFIPLAGASAQVFDTRFNLASDTSFNYVEANMDAMFAAQSKNYFKGGMGLDLGFTYQKMEGDCQDYLPNSKKYGCRSLDYKYKIGVSIIDIGSIKFNKEDVQSQSIRLKEPNYFEPNFSDSILQSIESLDNSSNTKRIRKVNRIHLPTAVSVQFDYNIHKAKFYCFGSIVQGIPISKQRFGMRRANSLMLGARFESRIFDIAVPFSLYDYVTPQVGLSLRLYCFTIGTDKLLSLVSRTKLYGADFYVHVNVPIFFNPKCGQKVQGGNKKESKKSARRKKKRICESYL
jgi:hypothetical protein